jgi:GDPmannose 4,6-dehydratase
MTDSKFFGIKFEKTIVDEMLLRDEIHFEPEDRGIFAIIGDEKIPVEFDLKRFRPAEVPILLSDTSKIQNLGFEVKHSLKDIIRDQLNYYLDAKRRI